MRTFSKLVEQVSFVDSLKSNSIHHVYETLNGTGKELLPMSLKIVIFAAISWLICIFSVNNWYVFPIVASVIVVVIIIGYFRSSLYFRKAAYTMAVYLFTQTALIFYIASLEISGSNVINRIVALLYILLMYGLSFYVIQIKLIENVQTKYLADDGKQIKKKRTIKLVKVLSTVLVSFIIVVIAGMQFYMVNKWWIDGSNYEFLSGFNGTLIGTVLSAVFVFIGIAALILITLLPTLLLDASVVVDGYIYKKYAEKYRVEYEFTEEEWYGK